MVNHKTILQLEELRISFGTKKKRTEVVHGISFEIHANEVVGLVGESGSGKSVTAMAMMGLLPQKTSFITGAMSFQEKSLIDQYPSAWNRLRGKEIAMIFQEPMSALNPSMKCGKQVMEMLQQHETITQRNAKKEVIRLFQKVKLPRPETIFYSYPHQLSGGQMQRVMIAMALSCKPKLLIADEPTTALDVTVQKEIMVLLKELQAETGMSLLFISHDLALVSEIADRVLVMYQGNLVEQGTAYQIFKLPKKPYTKALLASRPSLDTRLATLPTIAAIAESSFKPIAVSPQQRAQQHKKIYTKTPLLEVDDLHKTYLSNAGVFGGKTTVEAVKGVNFQVYEGETVGLVGESGCGKSTLGKVILQLEPATQGSIRYRGKELTTLSKGEIRQLRKEIQLIFQDPFASLNPRILIGEALTEVMAVHHIGTGKRNRKKRAETLLERVGLDPTYYHRYPHQLSGGQRQRVGIARTIAVEPSLIICDESVSALDISVQAQVLNLLNKLKERFNFTYIFISHDLAVVKYMADQLLVMNEGRLEEVGDADEVYANPTKEYTKRLIDAIPKGL
ncbi:ABC transporter ATP-binding protein [Altibacter sp. HG106]|nr:ABC transporter ATP-binding protein [Altibacter sp. HG106]MDC7995055.1 ABC transporter ATP-binding protein [Altibacter sp. HG106]